MCLAVPAQVALIGENRMAQVDTYGITRTVSLDLVPTAEVGSWVLVHAGHAIEVVDEQFAAETWDLIRQMIEAGDEYTIAVVGPLPEDDPLAERAAQCAAEAAAAAGPSHLPTSGE